MDKTTFFRFSRMGSNESELFLLHSTIFSLIDPIKDYVFTTVTFGLFFSPPLTN